MIESTDWFVTCGGHKVHVLSPDPEKIFLDDIAHALSRICRFGGHLRREFEHYSVAQHSVLVSRLVEPSLAREGLMHDASEAYLGDVIRPLKVQLPKYGEIESMWERTIAFRFGVHCDNAAIKAMDRFALLMERRDLVADYNWKWLGDCSAGRATEIALANHSAIVPLRSRAAYEQFMARARELGI